MYDRLRFLAAITFSFSFSNVVLGCNASLGGANYSREKRAKYRITSDSSFYGYQKHIRRGKKLLDYERRWKVAATKVSV